MHGNKQTTKNTKSVIDKNILLKEQAKSTNKLPQVGSTMPRGLLLKL